MESDSMENFKFIMFENKMNTCWLDSSMALFAHMKTIKKIASFEPDSKINQIVTIYNEAISVLNDGECSINDAKERLYNLQISILEYLQPILKYQVGVPDSAFCAILNLIYESKLIKQRLSVHWFWKKQCVSCGNALVSHQIKPIITLSKVNKFEPDCPTSIYVCSCKTEQERKLIYKELPPCLLFHFENGAGIGDDLPLSFNIRCKVGANTYNRKYQLISVITLEKSQSASVNHFITWIRHPFSKKWLECNDLNPDVSFFSSEQPQFNLKDIYMYIFEACDNFGIITNDADFIKEQVNESSVEIIDLSDESEETKCVLKESENKSSGDTGIETHIGNLVLSDSVVKQDISTEKQLTLSKELDDSFSILNLKDDDKTNCLDTFNSDMNVSNKQGNDICNVKTTSASRNASFTVRKKYRNHISRNIGQPKSVYDKFLINREKLSNSFMSCTDSSVLEKEDLKLEKKALKEDDLKLEKKALKEEDLKLEKKALEEDPKLEKKALKEDPKLEKEVLKENAMLGKKVLKEDPTFNTLEDIRRNVGNNGKNKSTLSASVNMKLNIITKDNNLVKNGRHSPQKNIIEDQEGVNTKLPLENNSTKTPKDLFRKGEHGSWLENYFLGESNQEKNMDIPKAQLSSEKMKQVMLKKDDGQHAIVHKNKRMKTNEQCNMVTVSKGNVKKCLPKSGKYVPKDEAIKQFPTDGTIKQSSKHEPFKQSQKYKSFNESPNCELIKHSPKREPISQSPQRDKKAVRKNYITEEYQDSSDTVTTGFDDIGHSSLHTCENFDSTDEYSSGPEDENYIISKVENFTISKAMCDRLLEQHVHEVVETTVAAFLQEIQDVREYCE